MTDLTPCFLYKETRINLDWDDAYRLTANIFLPGHHGGPSKRSSQHSAELIKTPEGKPDTLFSHRFLATAASVHYRPVERYPRCIMWRVLENAQVLSVTSVDFTKPNDIRGEFATTFRFYFPEPIRQNCVGFTDNPDRDELVIYALTTGNVIYTLNLSSEFLLKNLVVKKGSKDSDYCRTYSPNSFIIHSPHFLMAIDHQSLLVSLQDGTLLKLEKSHLFPDEPDTSISKYFEKTFSEGSYLSLLKSKMPFLGRTGHLRYGNDSVSFSAVISSAVYTPRQSHDSMMIDSHQEANALLFTVSVNHTLKIWALNKGHLLHAVDLLNEEPPTSNHTIKTLLDPAPSQLLTIIDVSLQDDHMCYLVSFSSATTGKFKFWAVLRDEYGQFEGLADLYPTSEFCADPPTANSVWIISEFRITAASPTDPSLFNLWVLWKSNTTFKVQNLQFKMEAIPMYWNKWTSATPDSLHVSPGRTPSEVTSEDITDYWIDWLFFPGRFTDHVLRTALAVYEDYYSVPANNDDENDPIKARVAKLIPAQVELQKMVDGSPDYDKYRHELGLQWIRYCRLCTELDKQRSEALSLVADPVSGFVWTVNADGITALRECTESEVILHNYGTHAGNLQLLSERTPKRLGASLQGEELSDVLRLIQAATDLKYDLMDRAYDNCVWRLQKEVLEDALFSYGDRMDSLYHNCIADELSPSTIDKIENAFAAMNDPQNAFSSILSSLFHSDTYTGTTKLTTFGGTVLVTGSQEVINVNHNLLFSLVFLLVLISVPEESPIRIAEPQRLFTQLLDYVREYEVLDWVSRTPLLIPDKRLSTEEELSKGLAKLNIEPEITATMKKRRASVLQWLLGENYGPPALGLGRGGNLALSECVRQFLTTLELGTHGNGFSTISSALLAIDAVGTAVEFIKYLPSTCWGNYVAGRIHLRDGNVEAAALGFRRSACGLAKANPTYYSAVKSLLTEIELESSLGKGLPPYYLHIASLFEEAKAPAYVAEFCQAALVALDDAQNLDLKCEILLKLFQSNLQISLYDQAYLALTQYTNGPLQRTALRELVGSMVEAGQGSKLCSYPFVGLQDEVDEALVYKCSSIIDVTTGPPFHKVLYAWRVQRGDYRGAAAILHERLQRIQTASVGSADPGSRSVSDGFLVLLNAMSCVGEEQAWILSTKRVEDGQGSSAKRTRVGNEVSSAAVKRTVVTVEDVRKAYQIEVERVGLLLNGGFFV
ncbi:uncharacterized protein LAJ45_07377 [Morchella importuna]|uniref:uncharacterized protein n=1 Tax=Morchella importuna TaxID=1174673 RepID=UPI001E8DF12F|nr:uncharacterized protein LAJ45_07377 [Morchella importuna]KAH8148666.1 hypothetical protein LAJ45_07377 [Morchella importuna]